VVPSSPQIGSTSATALVSSDTDGALSCTANNYQDLKDAVEVRGIVRSGRGWKLCFLWLL